MDGVRLPYKRSHHYVGESVWRKKNKKEGIVSGLTAKGQLISKCPFGIIVWTKIPAKLFLDFCPDFL